MASQTSLKTTRIQRKMLCGECKNIVKAERNAENIDFL